MDDSAQFRRQNVVFWPPRTTRGSRGVRVV
jgi:hypothetical protein